MSKIKDILRSDDSVLVFDIDGVLAIMEFGNNTHFLDDDSWNKIVEDNINLYTEDKVSKKMQNFLDKKDKSRIYVISKVNGDNEINQKEEYVNKYYGIYKENVYCVRSDLEKADKINAIKEKYKDLDSKKIVMIDDTADILTDVMEKTNVSTAHISTFLDM